MPCNLLEFTAIIIFFVFYYTTARCSLHVSLTKSIVDTATNIGESESTFVFFSRRKFSVIHTAIYTVQKAPTLLSIYALHLYIFHLL